MSWAFFINLKKIVHFTLHPSGYTLGGQKFRSFQLHFRSNGTKMWKGAGKMNKSDWGSLGCRKSMSTMQKLYGNRLRVSVSKFILNPTGLKNKWPDSWTSTMAILYRERENLELGLLIIANFETRKTSNVVSWWHTGLCEALSSVMDQPTWHLIHCLNYHTSNI